MSANDVSNMHGSQQPIKINVEQPQKIQKQEDFRVFASNEVGAEVSLEADESNTLFNRSSYLSADVDSGLSITANKKVVDLPPEFKHVTEPKDKKALLSLNPQQMAVALQFASTKLSGANIAEIVKVFNVNECKVIKTRVDELTESMGGIKNVYKQVLTLDSYSPSNFVLRGLDYDYSMKTELLDKKFNVKTVESLTEYKTNKDSYRIQEAYDLRTNTLSKVRYNKYPNTNHYVADYEIRAKLDKDNSYVSREFSKPSKIKGVKTVELLSKEGNKNVSSAEKKKDGTVVVQKNMTSIDGTKTLYNYSEKPNGNRSMTYKVVDSDGKVLMNNKKTYTVISANEFASTFNNKKYSMKIVGNNFNIVESTNPKNKATIDLSKIQGDKNAIIKSLTSMTGDELIQLSQSVKSMEGVSDVLSSYYQPIDKSMHTGADLFVALHELGHAKDYKGVDTSNEFAAAMTIENLLILNPELNDVYNKEREAFNNAFPLVQREHIDYFINILGHYGGQTGGISETVAEGNAIHNTPMAHDMLTLRTQYLQQYFPRTMVKLNEIFLANAGNTSGN